MNVFFLSVFLNTFVDDKYYTYYYNFNGTSQGKAISCNF